MTTFQKARLKLTAWYIVIILILLGIFSFAAITSESRAFVRLEQALNNNDNRLHRPQLTETLEARLNEFDMRFRSVLYLFDLGLLIVAGGASYFLSGRTLKPIQKMIRDQEEFSADVSHELRTPLTAIRTEIEAFTKTEKSMPQKYHEIFFSIQEEVTRMKDIVDGLLTLVRPDIYSKEQAWKVFDVDKVVSEAFKQMEALASQKQIDYQLISNKELLVLGREDQIKQVIFILIDNALKFTPQNGQVLIGAESAKDLILISVSDSGSGIPLDESNRIFERFYRGKERAISSDKGLGLGLAIAKKIIDGHNGRITLKSSSQGSTFTIELPRTS